MSEPVPGEQAPGVLHVRPARATDADELTELVFASKASIGYDADFMSACRAELAVTPRLLGTGSWRVAEARGVLLGCCHLLPRADLPDTACIEAFFVRPRRQHDGVGRALWSAVSTLAIEQGVTRLELAADPAAVGFYEKLGFSVRGSVPSGSVPGRRLPRMVCHLHPDR